MRNLMTGIILTVIAAIGCSCSTEPKFTVRTFGETPEARVNALEKVIKKQTSPPGLIRSAEGVEEQIGDGVLGPSDFRFFAKIVVEKNDITLWKSAAGPKLSSGRYAAPRSSTSWWLPETEFKGLTLYSAKALFGWSNGWIGFSPDDETLYVMTFTM